MDLALQLLFTGIGIGAVYALVALGFVLIFRATNVVNFAQGEFSMVAAFLMVVFAVDLGWPDSPGFQLGPVYLDRQYLIVIGVTLALVAFQYWLFEHTLIGKKLQATS